MAGRDSIPFCAYCAQPPREHRLYVHFPLLAAVARDVGIKLRCPASDYFHGPCGRRVFRRIRNSNIRLEERLQ